jgi:type II secretory pathway pseudopilin PulG
MKQSLRPIRRGAILAVALATLLVVTLLAGVVVRGYLQSYRQLRQDQEKAQAEWLADSALARALAQRKLDANYAGETWQVELPRATGEPAPVVAIIRIQPATDQAQADEIQIEARFPADDDRQITSRRTLLLPTDN